MQISDKVPLYISKKKRIDQSNIFTPVHEFGGEYKAEYSLAFGEFGLKMYEKIEYFHSLLRRSSKSFYIQDIEGKGKGFHHIAMMMDKNITPGPSKTEQQNILQYQILQVHEQYQISADPFETLQNKITKHTLQALRNLEWRKPELSTYQTQKLATSGLRMPVTREFQIFLVIRRSSAMV